MNRRQFLLASAGAAAALPALSYSGRLFATRPDTPRFLLVFLRGGYDCNNLLVPCASDFYHESRPTLAIARPDPANPDSAVALDSAWGLAPTVRDSLYPLWQKKQIAFVPFAGTDDLSRSHFETQDSIEAGMASTMRHNHRSGFLARLAGALPAVAPIAFTDALPLSFEGSGKDIENLSLKSAAGVAFDARQSALLAGMYKDTPLAAAATDGLQLRQSVSKDLQQEMKNANRGAASAVGFAAQAERMASLMRERFRLGFIDVGGWDTHVNQGGARGALANNLGNLGRGLAAYADALGQEWNNTVVIVLSEFGRALRENGGKGTDHGHGSVYWVLGGKINGARIVGEQIAVTQANLLRDRDYPVLNDYRDVLGGVLKRMWGLSGRQMDPIFPGARPMDLGLL